MGAKPGGDGTALWTALHWVSSLPHRLDGQSKRRLRKGRTYFALVASERLRCEFGQRANFATDDTWFHRLRRRPLPHCDSAINRPDRRKISDAEMSSRIL